MRTSFPHLLTLDLSRFVFIFSRIRLDVGRVTSFDRHITTESFQNDPFLLNIITYLLFEGDTFRQYLHCTSKPMKNQISNNKQEMLLVSPVSESLLKLQR